MTVLARWPRERRDRWHAAALMLFGAAIPVGEGLALGALILLALLLGLRWREVRWGVVGRETAGWVHRGLLLWFIAGLVALALGGEGWLKPTELGRWVPLLAVPVVVLTADLLPPRAFDHAVWAFALALAAASVFALLQFGLDVRPGEALLRARADLPSQGRLPSDPSRSVAGGFYFHRLKMAHVVIVGIGLLVARQLFAVLRPRRRVLELVALGLMLATLALTFTRAAWLAVALASALLVLLAPKRWRITGAVALAVVGVVALSVPSVRERAISAASAQASAVRGFIWAEGVAVIGDHPLGAGLGNYPDVIDRYYDVVDAAFDVRTYPHNVVLAAWAETGPLGLAGLTLAWTAPMLAALRRIRRRRRQAAGAAGGLFGLVALWSVGLTHDVLFHNAVALAFGALLGAVLVVLGRTD